MRKTDIYLNESRLNPFKVVMLDSSRELQDDRIVVTMKSTREEAEEWVSSREQNETVKYVIIEDTNLQRVGDRFRNYQNIDFNSLG